MKMQGYIALRNYDHSFEYSDAGRQDDRHP